MTRGIKGLGVEAVIFKNTLLELAIRIQFFEISVLKRVKAYNPLL